jgi:uncharacterized protein YggE
MTRLLATLALAALAVAPAAAALPEITVTVQGYATAMPDIAKIALTISTAAPDAASATSENNARYNRLLPALRALGIAESDIQTTSFNLSYTPPPRPPEVPQPGMRYGYSVYRSVAVTVRRLSSVGKVLDGAMGAGATNVDGVTFDNSNPRAQYAKALRDGVLQARAQAQAMAAAAGLRIVRIKSMQEGAPTRVLPSATAESYRMAAAAPVPTVLPPSPVETSATVTVTYEASPGSI